MLDRDESVRSCKKGKGSREIFALKPSGSLDWVVGAELDKLVAKQMPSFGQRSSPHANWGLLSRRVLRERESDFFSPPTWEEFTYALKQFRKNKGVRRGDCPGYVVASGTPWLQRYCFSVLVWMWNNPEKVPKRWWADQIRFIPKEDRDTSLLSGWRPIAVGGFFYGLMMRIWTKKLESAAEICGWLSDEQYGFRRGRSSRGAAAMVRVLAEKCDSAFCVVRGDIDRAFPSISPFDVSSMLSKLGVPSSFLNVLNHVYVGVEGVGVVNGKPGGVSGTCRWPIQGLRQGCPASPLLMALWIQNAVEDLKKKGFQCVSYADDIWIICPPELQSEAKRCMQSAFAGAGLSINPVKAKVWTPSSSEPLEVLGMLLFDGHSVSVANSLMQKTRNLLSGGREKEYSCFARVMYVNTVCLPAIRYKMSGLILSKSLNTIRSIDRMLRNFIRGKDWPSNTPIDFLSDTQVGLSLLSLSTECLRDLFSFVWSLSRGRESEALRESFLCSWKQRSTRLGRPPSLLDDWVEAVNLIGGKTFFDWNDEERELPPGLRTKSVFPFGSAGSFLSNSLSKWTAGQRPPPPCCKNELCFTNPCPILTTARAKGVSVCWITDAGKIGTNSRKGLFARISESEKGPLLSVFRVAVPVLEIGCIKTITEICDSKLKPSPCAFSFPPFLPFPQQSLHTRLPPPAVDTSPCTVSLLPPLSSP